MKKSLLRAWLFATALLLGVGQSWAYDLSDYSQIKSIDLTSLEGSITFTGETTAELSNVATPDALAGIMALQDAGTNTANGFRIYGGLRAWNGGRTAAVINLMKDYVVAITSDDATPVATAASNACEITEEDGVAYVKMSENGNFVWTVGKGKTVKKIEIYAPAGQLIPPSAAITAVNGVKRTVTIDCPTEGAKVCYTLDETDPTEASTEYTAPIVIEATTTVKAITVKDGNVSEVFSATFEAGTEISVATPVAVASMVKAEEVYNPSYTISANNSSVLLKPEVNLTATFNGAAVEIAEGFTFTEPGTLVVTNSAEGYASSSIEIANNNVNFEITKSYDFKAGNADLVMENWNDLGEITTTKQWNFNAVPTWALNKGAEATGVPGITFGGLATEEGAWEYAEGYGVRVNEIKKNNYPVSLSEGTADQFVGWTYSAKGYTVSSLTTETLAGDVALQLYRYDRMLTNVDVYSPVVANVPAELVLNCVYNEDYSRCDITVEPTREEGTALYYSFNAFEEAQLYEGSIVCAYTGSEPTFKYNVTVREYTDDEDMTLVAEGFAEIIVNKPIDIVPMAGDAADNPIVLVAGNQEINRDELGMDEENVTYFTYTAEKAGTFVFGCKPGNISQVEGLEEVESVNVKGKAYGKDVEEGEVVTFSAILPAAYVGTITNEDGEEDTDFFDVETYSIYAAVEEAEAWPVTLAELSVMVPGEEGEEVTVNLENAKVTAAINVSDWVQYYVEDDYAAVAVIDLEGNLAQGKSLTGTVTGTWADYGTGSGPCLLLSTYNCSTEDVDVTTGLEIVEENELLQPSNKNRLVTIIPSKMLPVVNDEGTLLIGETAMVQDLYYALGDDYEFPAEVESVTGILMDYAYSELKVLLPRSAADIKAVETPDSINNATVNATSTGAVYNLAGQKVSSNYKGIVVKNGKAVIVK